MEEALSTFPKYEEQAQESLQIKLQIFIPLSSKLIE